VTPLLDEAALKARFPDQEVLILAIVACMLEHPVRPFELHD
jgi:hypothetical protein